MGSIRTFIYYIRKPRIFIKELVMKYGSWLPDETYLRIVFWFYTGNVLHLNPPKTYNEKLQWLKLYNRKPEYTQMVDKYAVKEYVESIIGKEYIIPLLGVWDSPNDITWDDLPSQFVLKATHGGGNKGVVICKDKSTFDINAAVDSLQWAFNRDIYKRFREWPYKNVKKRIIAEQYIEEPDNQSLCDYKVMCFNGKAKLIEYHMGRNSNNHIQVFFDHNWNKTSITQKSYDIVSNINVERPAQLDKMLELSEILSKSIPHVRVDWYMVGNQLYFGELTFYDSSGFDPFIPDEYNYILGEWISLPNKK